MKERLNHVKKVYENLKHQLGNQRLSLALGDYVIYEGERINAMPYSWKMSDFKDKEVIITAISSDASRYCIEGWNVFVDRASLRYVRDADPESLTRIIEMLEPECAREDDAEEDESECVDFDLTEPLMHTPRDRTDPRDHRATQKAILAIHDRNNSKK